MLNPRLRRGSAAVWGDGVMEDALRASKTHGSAERAIGIPCSGTYGRETMTGDCALRASRVFEALSPPASEDYHPGLRYACPGLERDRLFEATAGARHGPCSGCTFAGTSLGDWGPPPS